MLDLNVKAGADFGISFTAKDSAGNAVDLSGYSARSQWRSSPRSDTAIDLTASIYGNVISLSIPNSITKTLENGVYDVELYTVDDGNVIRAVEGRIIVSPEVTRDA